LNEKQTFQFPGITQRHIEFPWILVDVIIDEESGWNPCVGLMQLMPQTAVRFGVRNRFRMDENIRGGMAYLACLNHEFPGPSEKAGIIFGRCAGICEPSG